MSHRILLIDDDSELCALLQDYLGNEGFAVVSVNDGDAGLAQARSGGFDIVILDVMLPRLGGLDVLREIRTGAAVPVLMLTARGDDVDRIVGLELGADDYLPKPCNPRELVARIRAILRRTADRETTGPRSAPAEILEVDDVVMRPGERMVLRAGAPVDLTSTEFSVLEILLRNAGQVVSKESVSEGALGRPLEHFDRAIDMHVSRIRRKLGPGADHGPRIKTVRGAGYLYVRHGGG
jgi:two-component system response regulator CpxR